MDKPALKPADVEAFRARWTAFMEGGWEDLLAQEPDRIEAVRRHVFARIPTYPQAMSFGALLAEVISAFRATGPQLIATLLEMERHGHVSLVAGWVSRPPPRVPRRGLCLEDMYFKFGCQEVSPDPELTAAEPRDTLSA